MKVLPTHPPFSFAKERQLRDCPRFFWKICNFQFFIKTKFGYLHVDEDAKKKNASSVLHLMLFQLTYGRDIFPFLFWMTYISPLKINMKAFGIPYMAINVVILLTVKFMRVHLKILYENSLYYLHTELFLLLRFLFCQLSRGMCVKVNRVSFFRTSLMYFAVSFCIFAIGTTTCLPPLLYSKKTKTPGNMSKNLSHYTFSCYAFLRVVKM